MNAAHYIDSVVAGLDHFGVPVLDSWVQEDDDRWETPRTPPHRSRR